MAAQQPAISAPGRDPAIEGDAYTPPYNIFEFSKQESSIISQYLAIRWRGNIDNYEAL
jgi:hypothetical protein